MWCGHVRGFLEKELSLWSLVGLCGAWLVNDRHYDGFTSPLLLSAKGQATTASRLGMARQ